MNEGKTLSQTFAAASQHVPAALSERAERVLSRCDAHYEKHRNSWIADRYTNLLLKESPHMELRPSWAQGADRKLHLLRAATYLVERKQMMRVKKINHIAARMSGLDPTNPIGR